MYVREGYIRVRTTFSVPWTHRMVHHEGYNRGMCASEIDRLNNQIELVMVTLFDETRLVAYHPKV